MMILCRSENMLEAKRERTTKALARMRRVSVVPLWLKPSETSYKWIKMYTSHSSTVELD